jgi:hypothetical protein
MNFLWIIQVLQLFLYSKSISKSFFLFSLIPGLGALLLETAGANSQISPRLRIPQRGRRVHSGKVRGLFCKIAVAKGYLSILTVRLEINVEDLLIFLNEPVRYMNRWIRDPRFRCLKHQINPGSLIPRSTAVTCPGRTGIYF